MENAKPSSSLPPYSGGARAGGKFRKPPISRIRPSTPYDRPSLPTANTQSEDGGGGWLSKLVVNPACRLIVGGATRILPLFLSKLDSISSDGYEDFSSDDHDDEDINATVNAYGHAKHTLELGVSSYSGDAGPSNEMDKLKGSPEHNNVQQDKSKNSIGDFGFDKIEDMLKGKQFSRDESNRLMDILESRLVDVSNAEGKKKAASVISQGQAKADVFDREIASTLTIAKRYDVEKSVVETPRPHLQSNMQDEVAASPIDIARAYMESRTSDLGFNTYNNISTDGREHQHNDMFPSKPHFLTPSSKSSTCWPGAMVQDQRGHLTPQTQRGRYGLHNFPRTPYSRTIYSKTKPKLNQLQSDNRSSNISLTPFQQSQTPNPWQMKTTSKVMDGGYVSVGPIRRVRNKFATEPRPEGPRSISSAQIAAGTSFTSRSFVPVFQKNSGTAGTSATSSLHTADKHEQNFNGEANPAGPSNEAVRKILEQLDRHKPTPKEKAAELKLATEWKRSPSQDTNLMPKKSTNLATGPDLQTSGVSSDYISLLKGTDVADPLKATNAANRTSSVVNDAGAAPSFGFRNTGVANEKSVFTHIKGKEKTQSCSLDNQINGQDFTRKRPSQPILKPISFNRQDPQQVISSDHGREFTFQFSATASPASEPPTPTVMPSFPATTTLPQSTELPAIPTYSFGAKKSNDHVFSFPSTSSSALVDDGESDLKFIFRSVKKLWMMKRVSKKKVGKYEIGRTIGEGTFAKVKFAKNTETGESVAVKVLAKTTILKHKMVDQIKREISIMKIVRHPNIVRLHEVLSSHTKIYIILEFVTGGELFDRIVHKQKLSEMEARGYFQQLIDAVAHCHTKGVFHRDLKPENLLLDSKEKLKVSDFGLSALTQEGVELLYTTCGTPNYIAPEVLRKRGYDGSAADIWSCGVILYVLLTGYLPFEESDLPTLYKKVSVAEFSYPFWFPSGAKSLIDKILDPNPDTRIRIDGIREHPWFQMNYVSVTQGEEAVRDVSLDDVRAVFDDIEDQYVTERCEENIGPLTMNAFEMITLSQGLNLSALFDRHQDHVKRQTRFVSGKPAKDIISAIIVVAELMGFKVLRRGYKTRLEGASVNQAGQFAVVLEVYEVAPSLFMVDVRKAAGDTLEYHKFYKDFCTKLDHIIWKPKEGLPNSSQYRTMTC